MKTKIEEAKDLKYQLENNKKTVQYCLGRKQLEEGTFVPDPRNDKHDFKFSTTQHHSSKPIYLDAYCGYFGDSNVSMFNNEFYIKCMTEAINKFLSQIREETERELWNRNIMKHYWKQKVKLRKFLKQSRIWG